MKKFYSFFVLLLCSLTVVSLSSCLNDDDDDDDNYVYLTTTQKRAAIMNASGIKTGWLKYYSYSATDYYNAHLDSVASTISLSATSDSTGNFNTSIPASVFYTYAKSDSNTVKSMNATANFYGEYQVSPTQITGYYNQGLTLFYVGNFSDELTFTDGTNTLFVTFNNDSQTNFAGRYFSASFDTYNSYVEISTVVRDITINGSTYEVNRPFIFIVK